MFENSDVRAHGIDNNIFIIKLWFYKKENDFMFFYLVINMVGFFSPLKLEYIYDIWEIF